MTARLDDTKPKRKAVENGELAHTSVSAMQKADETSGGCLRQWYYRYHDGLPDKPPGKGAIRGMQGHARIEEYLRTGQQRFDRVELEGLRKGLIPTPGTDLLVEEHFGSPTPLLADGVAMNGYIDLINPRHLEDGTLWITDWKFKKDIAEYGSTAEELVDPDNAAGIQMLGYGAWAIAAAARFAKPFHHVRLAHVTFQTQGRTEVVETATRADLTRIGKAWETVSRRIIPRMREAARAPHAQEVKRTDNDETCDKFGGCPYKATCLDRMAKLVSGFRTNATNATQTGEVKMGLLNSITNGTQTKPTPPPAAPAASTTPALAAAAPTSTAPSQRKMIITDETKGEIVARDAVQGAEYIVNGTPARFLSGVSMSGTSYASFAPLAGGMPLLVSPDSIVIKAATAAPSSSTALNTQPAALPLVLPPDAPKSDPALAAKVDAPAPAVTTATPAPAAEPIQTESTEPKKGRGRSKKSADTSIIVVPQETIAAAQEVLSKVSQTSPMVELPAQIGIYLYFTGAPVGVPTKTLHEYTNTLDAALREAMQMPAAVFDLRQCEGSTFGFGKWKSYLAKDATEHPPEPGHYVVTPGDERIETVANALAGSGLMTLVVR